MLKKKAVLGLAVCLFILFSVPSVLAVWTQSGKTGSWENSDSPSYLSGTLDHKEGYANFTWGSIASLSDGQGVDVWLNGSVSGQKEEWYWISAMKNFYCSVGLHGSGGAVYANVHISDNIDLWHRGNVYFGSTHYRPSGAFLSDFYSNNVVYVVRIFRVDSTHANVSYYQSMDSVTIVNEFGEEFDFSGFGLMYSEVLVVDSSVWVNPTVMLYTGHKGNGRFEISFSEVAHGDLETITDVHLEEDSGLFYYLNMIVDAVSGLFDLLESYTVVFTVFVPAIPIFLVLYCVDLGITVARTGNLKPVGDFFSYGFGMMLKIWGVLTGLFEFIREVLMFWK